MAADKQQTLVTRSFRAEGFWTHKFVDAFVRRKRNKSKNNKTTNTLVKPQQYGKPDMIVVRGNHAVFVEVKNADTGFAFAAFDYKKRNWLRLVNVQEKLGLSVWVCVILGTDPPHWSKDKYPFAKRAWLLPVEVLFKTEATLPQKTIPMLAGKGYRTELQEKKLDAIHLWSEYELPWTRGRWSIPKGHPFWKVFEKEAYHADIKQSL